MWTAVFRAFATALAFLEAAGEVEECERWSRCPAVVDVVENLSVEAAARAASNARRKAEMLPVALLIGFELLVVDAGFPHHVRAFAWYTLVSVWASARFDDLQLASPQALVFSGRGLAVSLSRTKTSGAGKKIQHMRCSVCRGCYLAEPEWLTAGVKNWARMELGARLCSSCPDCRLERNLAEACPLF